MKKLYVKPTASNVAYAVNENIALSLKYNIGDPGNITYINVERSLCNKEIANTGIPTGLIPGCTNIEHVMRNLKEAAEASGDIQNSDFMKLWQLVQDINNNNTPEDFTCY